MITVALVDDHIVVRSGFAQLLSVESDIQVQSEFSNALDAFRELSTSTVDVAVIDISMPNESGLVLLGKLQAKQPGIKVIILSIHDSASFVSKAINAGAYGYLSKRCGPKELVTAIRTVASGDRYLCADALVNLSNASTGSDVLQELTKREREVFEYLILGKDVKEIGSELFVSHKTIHVHRANILSKLGVTNNVDLIRFALHHKLLSDEPV
ncbi:DNA-binding response regulator in two-component regulatory system wtih UhpB [Vibrio nigripulchritudo MADA3029]|uniref:response regulator n=1 Tax=Vibrio nigripulchritudo TaxID=28173 RepID=UPI0003B2169B|nr:response regulator [Vibrio nigripulchritudo]CCN47702.1 DNA-binding response regulator in two-component regulatory system wtih UhpB [Vibrio nigripulchritudo MADA3020]CCN56085.1 DNA-binding response regulator in two-component regulatory system wtih UhpB [Vibrio nigripulchritudo MADA3021]CCN58879.1 DNA-binding response regulator in two-component regulatory system wtih UhpB [Vibrio nigripulchritudo MADA3029]BDU41197.1 DNA-binding response regulator [Vibrio nigripulchritudo]BDU46962.1 DNA-bindin